MSDLKQLARLIFHQTLAGVAIAETMQRKLTLTGSRLSVRNFAGLDGPPESAIEMALTGDFEGPIEPAMSGNANFSVDLAAYERIRVVAFGKASVEMTRGLMSVIGHDWGVEGVVVGPHIVAPNMVGSSHLVTDSTIVLTPNISIAAQAAAASAPRNSAEHEATPQESARSVNQLIPAEAPVDLAGFQIIRAGHPLPDKGSLRGARAILDLLRACDARTLVFFLLSGGGSSLVELPLDPTITLAEMRELHGLLVSCGASIDEINAVRKHLSAVKGGRLAAAAPEAMKLTLGVTDVPVGCESALGSGPTIPDPSTISDARHVVEHYALSSKLPAAIRAKFDHPGDIPETPKAGDAAFARSHFTLLLGMRDLFHHAHRAAEAQGFVTVCDNATDDWPLARAADYLLQELAHLASAHPGRRVAVIADGEVSSRVTGTGSGGRNSAFVLACARKIAEITRHPAGQIAGDNIHIARKKIAVLSAGTDGKDGSSPAAGAVADEQTLARAAVCGLDPGEFAQRSDSYNFFRRLEDTIETGPTGNNLRDLRVLLAE